MCECLLDRYQGGADTFPCHRPGLSQGCLRRRRMREAHASQRILSHVFAKFNCTLRDEDIRPVFAAARATRGSAALAENGDDGKGDLEAIFRWV